MEEILASALDDAQRYGLPKEKVFVFSFDQTAPDGENLATFFRPDQNLFRQPTFPVEDRETLERANSDQARPGYRISLFTDYERPLLLGRLRHELEHAIQWQAHGRNLFEFQDFLIGALHHIVDKRGGASYYNFIPMECGCQRCLFSSPAREPHRG